MAETFPQIRVSDGHLNTAAPIGRNRLEDGKLGSHIIHPVTPQTDKSRRTAAARDLLNDGRDPDRQAGAGESIDSQTAIDPLSKHILNRTNTLGMSSQKGRNGPPSEGESVTPDMSQVSARTSSEPAVARVDSSNSTTKDKKKGVSFLSRFINSKRKDASNDVNDEDTEAGDKRTEGMDADVFSQPIGFIPRFPAPPKYIKVRSHGKKGKDFNRLFLAQELRGRTGVEIAQAGGRLVENGFKHGDTRKDGSAVWSMEFSKDGKYLAAGGQDYAVRIWAVISTAEERHAHEKDEDAAGKDGECVRLNAPVFRPKPVQEYEGHTASVLDLSWSKNNFLLSSSMDKTVRLWHVTRPECLCCFKHSDFVTSIQFHPRDDRFFLAGSLDSKLRLWSIPDKSIAFWSQLPDLITAVAFTPDGKTAIAGCLTGLCLFYDTEGLKYQTQIHVRSAHGKNAKGSKVTGIKAINYPPDDPNGEVKLLITSNDSRVRVYNLKDKGLEIKLRGNENSCSQIHASFSDDAQYVICGSEDRKVYIWSTGPPEVDKDKRPVETFEAHSAIVTTAIIAPTKTKQLLGTSGDPLYDLCNPPPVTLVSRTDSPSSSSKPATEDGSRLEASVPPTPATDFSQVTKPEGSPAYIARSSHPDGNIIVTADYVGRIKVFRQDCAYQKRLRTNPDVNFSKKMLGRSNSVATRNSKGSRRDSLSIANNHPSSDRILSWRQSVSSNNGSSNNGSLDNVHPSNRSVSPRKNLGQTLHHSPRPTPTLPSFTNTPSIPNTSPPHSVHRSSDESKFLSDGPKNFPAMPAFNPEVDPLMLHGDQSYMFWNKDNYHSQTLGKPTFTTTNSNNNNTDRLAPNPSPDAASSRSGSVTHLGVPTSRQTTAVSVLSSEESASDADADADGEGEDVRCRRCGSRTFRARGGKRRTRLECGVCGEVV